MKYSVTDVRMISSILFKLKKFATIMLMLDDKTLKKKGVL